VNQPPKQPAEPYLLAHLQEALATDPRTDELGIEALQSGHVVVLSGTVTTAQRRDAAAAVAREVLGDLVIRNDVSVAELTEPTGQERFS
jgi:osmotically-inducible protein OsmY